MVPMAHMVPTVPMVLMVLMVLTALMVLTVLMVPMVPMVLMVPTAHMDSGKLFLSHLDANQGLQFTVQLLPNCKGQLAFS